MPTWEDAALCNQVLTFDIKIFLIDEIIFYKPAIFLDRHLSNRRIEDAAYRFRGVMLSHCDC